MARSSALPPAAPPQARAKTKAATEEREAPERREEAESAADSGAGPHREGRGARRKRETHEKLLRAAFRLFGERGVDGVAINEITEAADVGFGSFYNHFASKEAIYVAVVDAVFGEFGDTLERSTSELEDPAEVIAVCVRQTIRRAHAEPLWGRFFLREGFTSSAMSRALGARLLRDIRRGIEARRFDPADPMMAWMLAGGCVMATVAADGVVTEVGAAQARRLGLDTKNLASRAASAVLEALGLERAEAVKVATKPLPPFQTAPMFA